MKLLMQPLASIHVRTEPLLLTKVEVWWYLVVQLGPNLSPNFDQVRHVPLSLNYSNISSTCSIWSAPEKARQIFLRFKNIKESHTLDPSVLERCPNPCHNEAVW